MYERLAALLAALAFALPATAQEPAADEEDVPRGLRLRTDGARDGYTLVSPLSSRNVHLVDMGGEIVHTWETQHGPGGGFYLLENGNLLRCGREEDNGRFRGGGIGGRLQEFSWDGELVWEHVIASDERTQHHDVEPLPNGNVLVICWEFKEPIEAAQRGRDRAAIGEDGLWPDAVLELKPIRPRGAEVVWEWHAWDHLVQDYDADREGFAPVARHPGRIDINADHRDQPPLTEAEIAELEKLEDELRDLGYIGGDEEEIEERHKRPDWLHTNAVAYEPDLELIAISVPELCEVFIIDHSTTTEEARGSTGGRYGKGGELLWRWGNPRNYGAGTDEDQRLFYQHDPTWVRRDDGSVSLLLFNNGMRGEDGPYSQVLELALPFDGERGFHREPGSAFGPAEPSWVYEKPGEFHSPFISGAQRLDNGNTLVCQGVDGRVFEVTRAGEIVWDFWNDFGGDGEASEIAPRVPKEALFRATRIPKEHPGIAGRL